MDELNEGLGTGSRKQGGRAVVVSALVLTGLLVVTGAGVAEAAEASIETVNGKKYKMADAVMAGKITRFIDPSNDQLQADGTPAVEAPEWTDVRSVYVAGTRTPAKLRTKMQRLHPPGASDALYGSVARPHAKDRIVFVAVKMGNNYPSNARGQLVEVGLGGPGATPVQEGTADDTRAGVERFSLSGLFRNGSIATGDTDIIGREPGIELADGDYYNADSGVFGFYDKKKSTWYLAIPRQGDVDDITVSVMSTTGTGQVVDRLDLPGGGHFIDLRDPTGSFQPKAQLPRLSCRILETFSGTSGLVDLDDPEATLIRYTVGVDGSVGPNKATQLLAPAVDAAGPVTVSLTAVGSGSEPTTVQGDVSVTPDGRAATLSLEVPAGQWSFAPADEAGLVTPANERLFDHLSLTGSAGVRTGPGLDGVVAGDPACLEAGAEADTEAEAGADADGTDGPEPSADPRAAEEPAPAS